MQNALETCRNRAEKFVKEGVIDLTRGCFKSSRYMVSSAPVPTALAVIALTSDFSRHKKNIEQGAKYLKDTMLPGEAWGNVPPGPEDQLATAICRKGLAAREHHGGSLTELFADSALLVAKTWTTDFDRLIPGWLPRQSSPVVKLIETILGKSLIPSLETISIEDFNSISGFMPPYGRPTMLSVTLIREIYLNGLTEKARQGADELLKWLSPSGSWCEDIMVTSLAIMALHMAGLHKPITKSREWLCQVQYDNGGWPSFNQLANWAVGWSAQILGSSDPTLFKLTTPYLLKAVNSEGSIGTTQPYSYPDLDDTAIGMLGIISDSSSLNNKAVDKIKAYLLKLQNSDGSWSTFPSFEGLPPECNSSFPVYIKSEDITLHVIQALLLSGLESSDPRIERALVWLKRRQHLDGSWNSTWFLGKAYSTAQALDLLLDVLPLSPAVAKAVKYLSANQRDNGSWDTGSAGETGLAVYSLLRAGLEPLDPIIQKALNYLVSLQRTDGSFQPFYSGFYASRLYYEEPLSEALAALRGISLYLEKTQS